MASVTITPIASSDDLAAATVLFRKYAESLGIDLHFQDFGTELRSMPGKYAPPDGALFLARNQEGEAIGCVGLRPLSSTDGLSEMKRLYVEPQGRGLGVGKLLAESVIKEATRLRYSAIVLDTLESMVSARALYKSLGFVETEAYYDTPLKKDTRFLKLVLC